MQGFIGEIIIGTSYEKVLQKTSQPEFRNEIVIKKKVISYMSNGKAMIIRLIAEQIKKISLYKMCYYPKPYNQSRNKIKVELDLSNEVTKSDI